MKSIIIIPLCFAFLLLIGIYTKIDSLEKKLDNLNKKDSIQVPKSTIKLKFAPKEKLIPSF